MVRNITLPFLEDVSSETLMFDQWHGVLLSCTLPFVEDGSSEMLVFDGGVLSEALRCLKTSRAKRSFFERRRSAPATSGNPPPGPPWLPTTSETLIF